jgi:hypothetical protein
MISQYALEIFFRYGGDQEAFERFGSAEEKSAVSGDEWGLISELVSELQQLQAGILAPAYADRIRQCLAEQTDNVLTAERFLLYVRDLTAGMP